MNKSTLLTEQPGDGWISLGSGAAGKRKATNITDPNVEKKEKDGNWYYRKKPQQNVKTDSDVKQQQQNLVNKGYFIGTSGPNKNGVDGIPGKKTKEAQHALDSGIDSTSYNNIYKQKNPDLAQTIENIFGKQTPKEIPDNSKPKPKDDSDNKKVLPDDNSVNKKAQVQKARVIKTIHPKNW
jgi:peptidoglycan hydrolase-like protein with peptidoglycan-binding domain